MLYALSAGLVLAILAGCASSLPPADTLDGLLARVEHAYGGATQMIALRETGQLHSARYGSPARVTRHYVYPNKLRIDIVFPDGRTEQRLLNDDEGWRQGRHSSGPGYDAMRLQAARIGLPRLLLEQRDRLRELPGSDSDPGTRRLELDLTDHLKIVAHVDVETGRIVASQGLMPAMGAHLVFEAVYADFRDVDGALFAFHEAHAVMGRTTGETTFERVQMLPSLPRELFVPSTVNQ